VGFDIYFGPLHPLLAGLLIFVTGTLSIYYLLKNSNFVVYGIGKHQGVFRSFLPTFILAAIIILVDLQGGYSQDINVIFPNSLLFYPLMGFIAETVFHILPITLIIWLQPKTTKNKKLFNLTLPLIILISIIEPIFQVILGQNTPWVEIYQSFHIFVINYLGLRIFEKYDFLSMYSFRICYYLLWHVIWGYLRLKIIF
jgi:hypothetical protein